MLTRIKNGPAFLHFAVRKAVARTGNARLCPCCGGTFRKFLSVGSPRRPDAMCPNCGAYERHRLLKLEMDAHPDLGRGRTLHFAPEPAVRPLFERLAKEYVTTDLIEVADVQADITELPFEDDRWDLIICSHVLEHVPDDASAIRELRRVLAPGGTAIMVVPRQPGSPTDEDPSITDEAERIRRFGQSDHVRMYGDDLEERLRTGGFDHLEPLSADHFSEEQNRRNRLRAINSRGTDAAYFCSTSPAG